MRWLSLVMIAGACAPVSQTVRIEDLPLPAEVAREVVPDSSALAARADVDGDRLIVTVTRAQVCRVITTPRHQRTRHVHRTVDRSWQATAWTLTGLGLGLGLYSYLDADGLAMRAVADDPTSTSTAGDFRALGITLGVVGAVAAVVGVGNHLRGGDAVEDGGIIDDDDQVDERRCGVAPVAGAAMTLELDGLHRQAVTSDGAGRVEIALTDVALDALPRADRELAIELDGERARFEVPAALVTEIEEALLANPASLLARDAAERRQLACDQAAFSARGSIANVDDEPETVLERWADAQRACGTLWTAAHRESAATARELVGEVMARRAAAAAEVAAQQALRDTLAAVEAAMDDGDGAGARQLVAETPAVTAIVTDYTRDLAWALMAAAVDDVLTAQPSRAEAAEAMCQARRLFETLVGRAALTRGVQHFVNRVGSGDPTYATRVIGALKAGKCN